MKLRHLLKLPVALIADIVTLGGACNDAYFHNGRRTYTGAAIRKLVKKQP